MKRADRIIVPDSYEKYDRLERERAYEKRLKALEQKVNTLEAMFLDK